MVSVLIPWIVFRLFFKSLTGSALVLGALLLFPAVFYYFKLRRVSIMAKRLAEGKSALDRRDISGGWFGNILEPIEGIADSFHGQIRAALEEKKRLFAILESMAEGVMAVDPEQRVVLINTMLASLLGVSAPAAAGRYFWEIFRDPEVNEMITRCLSEKITVKKVHAILLSKNVFEIQVSPVTVGEDFLGVTAVFHDVTKLKDLERMRSEFVANVSHELKTPLTSIMGFVETLKEGAIEDAEVRSKFLGVIDDQSKQLNALIEDILTLSKVESGELVLKKEPVSFEEMLMKVQELFNRPLRKKQIKLDVQVTPKGLRVYADKKLIEEALTNLMDNAVKYNRESGEIFVKAFAENGQVTIELGDTGIGIPEADLGRIFERFYRVDKSRARETGGTGLGLSIVKHIVERHGGRIEAKSQLQKGSVFTVTLPQN